MKKIKDKRVNILKKIFQDELDKVFIVGGFCRDFLMENRISKDLDIAVAMPKKDLQKVLNNQTVKDCKLDLNFKGIPFGSFRLVTPEGEIEITSFRKEIYGKNRYPKTSFTNCLLDDAQRRDFTVNAIYYSLKDEAFIYPFFEIKNDLKNRRIRFIGNPPTRIKQDPIRILRFFRFYKKYEMWHNKLLDRIFPFRNKTLQSCKKHYTLVEKLSKNNIKKEILKDGK